jgi:hypothetical protein
MYDELESIGKEAIISYMKVLFQNSRRCPQCLSENRRRLALTEHKSVELLLFETVL